MVNKIYANNLRPYALNKRFSQYEIKSQVLKSEYLAH